MEEKVSSTLSGLEGELKGTFYPLTGMSKEVQQKLIDDHFLFKEGDRFLQAANACRFWPTGRGIFHNDAKTFLVWCNEEDHLRIISMQMGGDLGQVQNAYFYNFYLFLTLIDKLFIYLCIYIRSPTVIIRINDHTNKKIYNPSNQRKFINFLHLAGLPSSSKRRERDRETTSVLPPRSSWFLDLLSYQSGYYSPCLCTHQVAETGRQQREARRNRWKVQSPGPWYSRRAHRGRGWHLRHLQQTPSRSDGVSGCEGDARRNRRANQAREGTLSRARQKTKQPRGHFLLLFAL